MHALKLTITNHMPMPLTSFENDVAAAMKSKVALRLQLPQCQSEREPHHLPAAAVGGDKKGELSTRNTGARAKAVLLKLVSALCNEHHWAPEPQDLLIHSGF